MAGPDPAIHAFAIDWTEAERAVDHRDKPGDDDYERRSRR
jgi:hypothetical protein